MCARLRGLKWILEAVEGSEVGQMWHGKIAGASMVSHRVAELGRGIVTMYSFHQQRVVGPLLWSMCLGRRGEQIAMSPR